MLIVLDSFLDWKVLKSELKGCIQMKEQWKIHIFHFTLMESMAQVINIQLSAVVLSYFFCLDFLSRSFTNHRTAEEGGEHFFIFSLSLPPASQALRY